MHLKTCFFLVAIITLSFVSCRESTQFELVPSSTTGISFNNVVTESDSINPLDMEYLYNGGGVAIGDFNADDRPDIYFTSSQTPNKLYLNKGDFEFQDVTDEAGVGGMGRWCNGASVVDINNDGLDDIYVCASIKRDPNQRTNLLYINKGKNPKGIPVFKEMSREYNLADTSFSVHAAFFDYDRDGDLDVYIATTDLAQRDASRFEGQAVLDKKKRADKLYRNEGSDSLGHPFFTNVSKEAGIYDEGYALGLAVADVNNDGWKDIYVTNDFFSNDLLYINNKNGTFTDYARTCLKHTSQNAMGNDVADINNDGLEDIIAVDMNPEDNFRKKKNMSPGNYYVYQAMLRGDYVMQYVRNTLQLNNGNALYDSSKRPLPSFSDISFYAGVAETDWSWNPSLADFDNDGLKDLIITNGYPKDVTDHDFTAFRTEASKIATKEQILEQIPQIKIPNYAFRNTGTLQFENVTKRWGFDKPCFSAGAAYVDLDADGDLDYVISNINDEAFVYRNNLNTTGDKNYLAVRFEGTAQNRNGIGAIAKVFANGKMQTFDNTPYRGYLSSVNDDLHFGIGAAKKIDSLLVVWPDGKQSRFLNIEANRRITVKHSDARTVAPETVNTQPSLFRDITSESGVDFIHEEFDYIDFDRQKLLPRRFSQFGPPIAVGDVDGNGLEDFFVGASGNNDAHFFLQQSNGKFTQRVLPPPPGREVRKPEMMGTLVADFDRDGDLDLYTSAGSNEFVANSKNYQDRLYVNDGKGNFAYDSLALPVDFTSKSCVKAADFDKDGDLDLFVGGRILPEKYPMPVNSFIYRNDSKKGIPKFTDVTTQVAGFLNNAGLVCDAIWSDFNNDGWIDLVIASEWQPIRFFKNSSGRFAEVSSSTGINDKHGWWGSLAAGDFDNDGDIDYIAGNVGLNSFFKASDKEPIRIYAADFNKDNFYDAIPSIYLPDEAGVRKEFPVHVRDEMVQQLVGIRKKYNRYTDYAHATIHDILPDTTGALKLHVNHLSNSFVENLGNGKFTLRPLPVLAQMAPVYGMVIEDVNQDGNLDVLINGNDYGNEITNGHYDALHGLVLLGNGKAEFQAMNLQQSGFFIPGDGKALAKIIIGNTYGLAASQNKGALKVFGLNQSDSVFNFGVDDIRAVVHLRDGRKRTHEFYFGDSFLSQSSRTMLINKSISQIEVFDNRGGKRTISF